MATEKVYYVNQYQRTLCSTVRTCTQVADGWNVVLDRTIFYPTGGGQPCDLGQLSGVAVLDVREEAGEVVHRCAAPLAPGTQVAGEIDWERRFMLMQQHSGEHIVSGVVHARFGYENVGFHMGSDVITIDFSGELSAQELAEVEDEVNRVIYRNLPIEYLYPDAQTLSTLSYRSKKELSGWVRIVQVGQADLCACCGLHVGHTGEIGLVKLLSTTRFRTGSRVELLSGQRALRYLNDILEQNREISALLSARPLATAAAVRRLCEEASAAQYRCTALENELFENRAAALAGQAGPLLFEPPMEADALRRLADALLRHCSGRCCVFAGADGSYKYAIGQTEGDLRPLCRDMNAALHGRGGGKPLFVQGSLAATQEEIRAYFAKSK